jgi:hypothetical protein
MAASPDAKAAFAAAAVKPRTLRLYETLEALDILDELIAEHAERIAVGGGDIESVPEIAELLAFAEEQFETAAERWGLKIRTLLAEAQCVDIEISRLNIISKSKTNAANGLKAYLKRMLEVRNIAKVQTPLVRLRIQANSRASVTAVSETAIDTLYAQGSPFVVRQETFKLDSDLVLEAQKNGEEIPAEIVITRGSHLRVE